MGYRLITAPTVQPLTLAQLKADLRIDHANDDASIQRMMVEAQEWLERRLQLKLTPQTWEYTFDAFPVNEVALPFGPVQSIVSVKYFDTAGDDQTMASADYFVDAVSYSVRPKPWLLPVVGWPATIDAVNAVRVTYVAGYVDAAAVPPSIVTAFRLKVREIFDGDDTSAQVNNMLMNYDWLLA